MNKEKQKLNLFSATNFVIANMVGTGVFTTLGFQLLNFSDFSTIFLLWFTGGLLALFGAFAYAELGTIFPRSGGEYNFLQQIYHPALGFLAGWTSITIGFAAPVGLASIAFGNYFYQVFPFLSPKIYALLILSLITLFHIRSISLSSGFQNIFTLFKILFILVYIIAGLFFAQHEQQKVVLSFDANTWTHVFSSAFFVSLIYVSYAYSGWNASAYFVHDLKNPRRHLAQSLIIGSSFVMLLYILLNYTFMKAAPVEELKGQVEVGFIAAQHIFNTDVSKIMDLIISLLLISSISSMVFTGPRVLQVIGEDVFLLRKLAYKTNTGVPIYAVLTQYLISALLILFSNFENLLTFTGFTLNIFTFLTVLGVFVMRYKRPDLPRPVKTIGHPFTTLFFMIFNASMAVFLLWQRPLESFAGFGLLLVGYLFYLINKKIEKP
jgi:APA family basic amino acid/polyamine antiporter